MEPEPPHPPIIYVVAGTSSKGTGESSSIGLGLRFAGLGLEPDGITLHAVVIGS